MIYNFMKKQITSIGLGVVGVLLCISCDTDLVETYEQYVPEQVISLAMPDSVAPVATAYNKILFKVFVNADPKIKKAVVTLFDDDITDDDEKIVTVIDINRTIYKPEIYQTELELPEGGSEYFVHLEDSEGNKSIKYDVFGTVLGDTYKESLQARHYDEVTYPSEVGVVISWTSNRRFQMDSSGNPELDDDGNEIVLVINNLLVKTAITYTSSTDGTEKTIEVDESEDETIISDFVSEGTFSYVTYYRVAVDSPYFFESNPNEGMFPEKI